MADIERWLAKSGRNDTLLYLAPTYGMAKKIMWRLLIDNTPKMLIRGKPNIGDLSIETIYGAVLYLGGATNYDTFRGLSNLRKAWFDECQDIPEEAWTEVVRAGISDTEGDCWFAGTPKGMGSWFYDMTMDNDIVTYHYTTIDGGFVKESEIEKAKRQLDKRTFSQEYLATFENYAGVVYYGYKGTQVTDREFSNSSETYLTWDFNVDPMSCIVVQKENNIYYVVKEFVLSNCNTEETCQVVKAYLDENQFTNTLTITGDNTAHGRKTAAVMSDYSIIDKYFPMSQGNIRRTKVCYNQKDRTNATNSLFSPYTGDPRMLINKKNCPKLHKDLTIVTWKDGGTSINKKHGVSDPSDALSYLPFNFEAIEQTHEGAITL
jgi:hypothetical protein